MKLSNLKSILAIIAISYATVLICNKFSSKSQSGIPAATFIPAPKITYTNEQISKIDTAINKLCKNKNFNGVILIGQKDSVLYKKAYGYANIRTKELNTDTTAFQLASVSKQFTAVAILQLYERGKLKLDGFVTDYIPSFPYSDITIHQLLVHRSGLPNYHYLCDRKPMLDDPFFSNQQIIGDLIEANEGRYFLPNRRFQYSNTGYAVLAAIVEIVSGLKFEKYLDEYIFRPLQMKNTFAYRAMKSGKYPSHAIGYVRGKTPASDNYLDHYLGDKGIYSSIDDLFKWDQGLYKGTIINTDTLQLAFRPMGKRAQARSNYGYGWRITSFGDSEIPIQFHSGWWHGFKTSIVRIPQDSATVIILRNNNRNGISINQILDILYTSDKQKNTDFEDDANNEDKDNDTLPTVIHNQYITDTTSKCD